jgi:threonine dehydratase
MLINRHKIIVEYSGAVTTAALLSGQVKTEGRRVAVIISGGNLDPSLLAELT